MTAAKMVSEERIAGQAKKTMKPDIAFDSVYREFQPKILRYLSRMAGENEAEDLTQEVFSKVNRSLDSFKQQSKLSTWIYRIATNAAFDRFRSSSFKHRPYHAPDGNGPDIEAQNAWTGHTETLTDHKVIRKEMNECIREYIEKLPHNYRSVIILSEIEGLKNREIADILEVSLDTVKIRLHRARSLLKTTLKENCTFYHNKENTLSCDRKIEFPRVTKQAE